MSKPSRPLARFPSLEDQVVLITGGASGIGAEMVRGFARQGARVGFLDIADSEGRALVESIAPEAKHVPEFRYCDLTQTGHLKAVIGELSTRLGPVEVLVNNAANDERHEISQVTEAYWDGRMAVNLRHQFFAAQCVVESMKERKSGSIINLSSISWHAGVGGMVAYVTAKAAVTGLTRALARELGPHGIRVNAIVPGAVLTERQQRLWFTEELMAEIMGYQCLKQSIYPIHIVQMALFLASADSERCTGREFFVDAGWL